MVTDLIDRSKWHLLEARPDGEAWRTDTGLTVIYSTALEDDGREWLHVSASRVDRIPSYSDMTRVKNAFIGVHRTAYSVWAPASEHVNIHPNCLHLWAVLEGDDPLPDFTRGTGSI